MVDCGLKKWNVDLWTSFWGCQVHFMAMPWIWDGVPPIPSLKYDITYHILHSNCLFSCPPQRPICVSLMTDYGSKKWDADLWKPLDNQELQTMTIALIWEGLPSVPCIMYDKTPRNLNSKWPFLHALKASLGPDIRLWPEKVGFRSQDIN